MANLFEIAGKLELLKYVVDSGSVSGDFTAGPQLFVVGDVTPRAQLLRLPPELKPIAGQPTPLMLGENMLPQIPITQEMAASTDHGVNIGFGLIHQRSSAKLKTLALRIYRANQLVYSTIGDCGGCGEFVPPDAVGIFTLDAEGQAAIRPHFVEGNSVSAEVDVTLEMGEQGFELEGYLGVFSTRLAGTTG